MKTLILITMVMFIGCAQMGAVLQGAGNGLANASHQPIQKTAYDCTGQTNGPYFTANCR